MLYESLKSVSTVKTLSESTKNRINQFIKMMEGFKKDISGHVAPLVERVLTESGLEKSLAAEGAEGKDALENVAELISGAAVYDNQTENPSLVDYLQQIALFSDVDVYDAGAERVALMTLHSAKGLEFDNVFIVGVEEGLLPHERSADDGDETEEERRLFFVGITRAKTNLHVSCAKYRQIRGQTLRTIPSQFLFELRLDFCESSLQSTIDNQQFAISNHQSSIINHKTSSFFKNGDIVVHRKFGIGTVKDFADMGENSIVTVAFNSGLTKSLMTKYAKLAKI